MDVGYYFLLQNLRGKTVHTESGENKGEGKMNKGKYISLALIASLLFFALAIPFGNATMASQGTTISSDENSLADSAFQYHANPEVVDFTRYGGTGFLYNTVVELRNAYDLNPLYAAGYNGTGQTVVIVDAFGSPTIYQDLLSFDLLQNTATYFSVNLPWTTMADVQNHLQIYYPQGQQVFNASDSNQLGWSQEVTLDVCMVHAIAPGANIALVISPTNDNQPLTYAVQYALFHHLGSVISQSWGDPEWDIAASGKTAIKQMMQAHLTYFVAAIMGVTVFASAGDWGASNFGTYNSPLYPSSDPFVTAVGGTNLFMTRSDGYKEGTGNWANRNVPPGARTLPGTTYNYEIAGNDYEGMVADGYPAPSDMVTTGGAMSQFFTLPFWQHGITMTNADGTSFKPTMRCTSDVSFDSGVYGGIGPIPWSADAAGITYTYIFGGTSCGSPFWAALTAIANQKVGHRIGYINPLLYADKTTFYSNGAFHDITMGDNTYPTGNTMLGYEATKGWDAPTGIGSPDATNLILQLKGLC
jgi:subtilase family serine protease